jgi:hypothetical protein
MDDGVDRFLLACEIRACRFAGDGEQEVGASRWSVEVMNQGDRRPQNDP